MNRTALYAGSFDPVTNGHLDVVHNALTVFDHLVVAVGVHHAKTPLLSVEDRLALLDEVVMPLQRQNGCRIEIVTFDGLVIDAARRAGAGVMVRGLRSSTDFDYEMQMAGMNAAMEPAVRTVFFPASAAVRPITASLVRQITQMGGDISSFVPQAVLKRLTQRFAQPEQR